MEHLHFAVAEVPTGIPTGLPPAVADAASKVVAEGGLTGALLIIALFAIAVLGWVIWLRQKGHEAALEKQQVAHDRDRDEWESRHRKMADQRIEEIRQVMTALNNNTGALNVISQTQADRTASMERLAAKLSELSNLVGNLDRSNQDHTKAIDRNLAVIERVAWAVNAKGSGVSGGP